MSKTTKRKIEQVNEFHCCEQSLAWCCDQPANENQSARPWLGMEVTCRPDGGGWALETGIVHADETHAHEKGWFKLVNARYPAGILTHTQEVYPPGFTGCTLTCCRHRMVLRRRRNTADSKSRRTTR